MLCNIRSADPFYSKLMFDPVSLDLYKNSGSKYNLKKNRSKEVVTLHFIYCPIQ